MLKDFSNQRNVTKQEVAAAIAQLQEKNWDINAYTVADELHVQRSVLYRNSELMDLITEARSQAGHATEVLPEQAIKRATMLEQVNHELEERIQHLEQDISDQAKKEQEAWQLGYKAGFDEGMLRGMEEAKTEIPQESELEPTSAEDKPFFSPDYAESLALNNEEEEEDLPWAERPFMSGILDELVQKEYVPGEKGRQSLSDYPLPESSEPKDSFEVFTSMQAELPRTPISEPESDVAEDKQETASADIDGQAREEDSQEKTISQEELADLLKKRREKDMTVTGSWSRPADAAQGLAKAKFVSAAKPGADTASHRAYVPPMPPDVRKACLMLGIRQEDLTVALVHESWKREITKPGTHPDHGGDTEMAMYLNTAKDVLLRWLEAQAPKLGKKFGANARDSQKPAGGQEESPQNPT
jgi:hypothetical protein